MFEIPTLPAAWRSTGVPYWPNVGDNQKSFRAWQALAARPSESLAGAEIAELARLERLVPELVYVVITPYSAAEYEAQEAESALAAIQVEIDEKTGRPVVKTGSAKALGGSIALDVCRKRILSVHNLNALEAELDETGQPIFDELGALRVRRRPITTGEELVRVIMEEASLEHRALLEDIFLAIKDRSHLEAGLKKVSAWPAGSSPPVTRPSGGAAPRANPAGSPARTIPTSSSSG
jgi:hypothetical protein